MSDKRILEFNALPESSRRRFVASVQQTGEPKPLYLNEAPTAAGGLRGGVFACAGAVVLIGLFINGLGTQIDGGDLGFGFFLGGVALVLGTMQAIRARSLSKRLPYPEGSFLLPVDLVVAAGEQLTLRPLTGLVGLNAIDQYSNGQYTHTQLRLNFTGGDSHTLDVSGRERTERLVQLLHQTRARNAAMFEAGQIEQFAALDPFYEARTSSEWDVICTTKGARASGSPSVARIPLWFRRTNLFGSVAGVVLGIVVVIARGRVSDDMMFARVSDKATADSYRAYLDAKGTRHADEIRDLLIAAEFEEAKAKRSVSSLRDYRTRYPQGPFDDQAKQAIHELFGEATATFETQAKRADPKLLEFMRPLFAWLEANDSPPVQIRFRPPDPSALIKVDQYMAGLSKEELEGAVVVPISPSFGDERSLAREDFILTQLTAGFHAVVPADILDLELGERLRFDADVGALAVERPTITVSYLVDASGSLFTEPGNPRSYVGIAVYFVVTMLMPDTEGQPGPEPLSFMLEVEPPDEFTVSSDGGIAIKASDQLIYDVMTKKAFETLARKLRRTLFSAQSDEGLELISGKIPELPSAEFEPELAEQAKP